MTTKKVNEIVDKFEELTREEKQQAFKLIASAEGFRRPLVSKIRYFRLKQKAVSIGDIPTEQAKTWGEKAVALIESLDLGDWSDVGDSVDWLKQQRNDQNARRLGNRD